MHIALFIILALWVVIAAGLVVSAMRFERHVARLGRGKITDGSDPQPQGGPE